MSRKFNHNALPQNIKDALNLFPSGTAAPVQMDDTAAIVLTCSRNDADVYHHQGVVVSFTPQLHLRDTAAVWRFEMQFLTPAMKPLLTFDCFLYPSNDTDYQLLRKFARMDVLDIFIYDLALNYLYTKRINVGAATRRDMQNMLVQTMKHNGDIRVLDGKLDYTRALEEIKRAYTP